MNYVCSLAQLFKINPEKNFKKKIKKKIKLTLELNNEPFILATLSLPCFICSN